MHFEYTKSMKEIENYYTQLNKTCRSKGLSLRQVCKDLDINMSTYNRWVKGDCSPTHPMASKILEKINE